MHRLGAPRRSDSVRGLASTVRLTLVLLAVLGVAAPTAGAALKARGSIEQAYVLGAKKGKQLQLLDKSGSVVAAGRPYCFGSKIFREAASPGGATVNQGRKRTKRFKVLRLGASRRAPTTGA